RRIHGKCFSPARVQQRQDDVRVTLVDAHDERVSGIQPEIAAPALLQVDDDQLPDVANAIRGSDALALGRCRRAREFRGNGEQHACETSLQATSWLTCRM